MQELIDWLTRIELLAHEFYKDAAEYFSDDVEFKTFLLHLADDEADHYQLMGSAAKYLSTLPHPKMEILVDDAIKTAIEAPFLAAMAELKQKKISKETVITLTVDSERSEWNDLFLYVLSTLKIENKIFAHAAKRIEQHVRQIGDYLESSDYGREQMRLQTKVPYAKKLKVLIVDDEQAISQLVARMLDEICECSFAENGAEALSKIKANAFDLIISDVDMPLMSGPELYQNSAPLFRLPNEFFIFHTGDLTHETQVFFETDTLEYLTKPFSIIEIRDAVMKRFRMLPRLTT